MSRRWSNLWLTVAVAVFLVCLVATFYAHRHYVQAETVYKTHLNRVVFVPHANTAEILGAYLQPADHWLHVQTLFGATTVLASVNVVVQVVRRRNARLAETGEDSSTESEVS